MMNIFYYIVFIISFTTIVWSDILSLQLNSQTSYVSFSLDEKCREYQSFGTNSLSGYWRTLNGDLLFYGSDSTCGTILFQCNASLDCNTSTINNYFTLENFENGTFGYDISTPIGGIMQYNSDNCSGTPTIQDYVVCPIDTSIYYCDFNYIPALNIIVSAKTDFSFPTLLECQTRVINPSATFNFIDSCLYMNLNCSIRFPTTDSSSGSSSNSAGSQILNTGGCNSLHSFL